VFGNGLEICMSWCLASCYAIFPFRSCFSASDFYRRTENGRCLGARLVEDMAFIMPVENFKQCTIFATVFVIKFGCLACVPISIMAAEVAVNCDIIAVRALANALIMRV
jgi:hypothetical protein